MSFHKFIALHPVHVCQLQEKLTPHLSISQQKVNTCSLLHRRVATLLDFFQQKTETSLRFLESNEIMLMEDSHHNGTMCYIKRKKGEKEKE